MFVRSCLAFALVIPPATAGASLGPATPSVSQTGGTLELYGGGEGGSLDVRGPETAAEVNLKPGETVQMQLPAGRYQVAAPGSRPSTIELSAGGSARFAFPGQPDASEVKPSPSVPHPKTVEPKRTRQQRQRRSQPKKWKRMVAPLVSTVLPGGGQLINGQPGKGLGMFLGTISLLAASSVMAQSSDPLEGARPGQLSDSFRSEVLAKAGYGVLTGGLHLLYMGQILDAYANASGVDRPRPKKRHRFSAELTRMASVGYRVGDPAADFYADWNLSLMLQAFRRLSVGIGDISLKMGSDNRTSFQAGPRVHYRVFDRSRLWIGLGAGVILQGSIADGSDPDAIVYDAPRPGREASFAAIPYGQADFRYFILDRWSLNLVPRVSAPIGTRFFRGDRAVPSHAVTFELGTGIGVYF